MSSFGTQIINFLQVTFRATRLESAPTQMKVKAFAKLVSKKVSIVTMKKHVD